MTLKKKILLFSFLLPFGCASAFAARAPLGMTPVPKAAAVKVTPAYVAALKKQAAGGDAAAEFNLAVLYHTGEGVTKNYQKSLQWMEKAAADGDKDAPLNLYAICTQGNGVEKNPAKAAKWCMRAARAGNVKAYFVLSDIYRYGRGAPQNARLSAFWLLRGLQAEGKLPSPRARKPAFNVKAALLSGLAGLMLLCGIMFVYLYRRKKQEQTDA